MAAVDQTRYNDLCRLCAEKTTMVLGVHIFQNDGIISQVHKKIQTCLPIQVHETDELPKLVCTNCLFKLNLLSEFRERTVRTEQYLHTIFKELNSVKQEQQQKQQQQQQQSLNVVIEQNDLIMVPHSQLINDIDIHQLTNTTREQMIVGHEIILTHQHDINGHSLDELELNHELAQDISNHNLQGQDTILVETSNGHERFTGDNLHLIQHQQLLTEQFRLDHDLKFTDTDTDASVMDITAGPINSQEVIKMEENSSYHVSPDDKIEYHNSGTKSSEQVKMEDNNSNNSLLIDDQFNKSNDGKNEQLYVTIQNNGISNNTVPVQSAVIDKYWVRCNLCDKTFEEQSLLNEHYTTHFETCEICLSIFMNSELLKAHRKEVHSKDLEQNDTAQVPQQPVQTRLKRATLPVKDRDDSLESNSDDSVDEFIQFTTDDNNDKHSGQNNNNKRKSWQPKVCTHCGKHYKTNYKLNEHMRKHTGEKPYKCTSCDKEFRSKIGLAQHAAKHTGKYDYSCPVCGKGFQCKSYLMVHQRVHSDVKPYPCTTCGQNFKTKQSLLDHTNRHLGVKPYMCEICGRGFITKGLCKAHQKVHTGLDNRKYSCKVCNKKFVSKSYLQTHLKIHTGEKPFKCEVCGKGFLTKVDLRIHTTMHTGEKSFICEMCGKAFARRDALRCHRRSHTGERPYSCDLCGQTFTQFTPMAIHKRLHTGERPYACEVCGKTFVSRSTMLAHAKKHIQ